MKYKEVYPLLFAFFDGSFSANGGGKATQKDFERFVKSHPEQFSTARLERAETELHEFCHPMGLSARQLGMQADSGYTVWGQTMQNEEEGGDDERHVLVAYELLDEVY